MIWSRPLLLELAARQPEQLVELVLSLQAQKEDWRKTAGTLQQQLREKNQEISQQQEKLEQAKREAFRQAAPFRRNVECSQLGRLFRLQPSEPGGLRRTRSTTPGSIPRENEHDRTKTKAMRATLTLGRAHLTTRAL